LFARFGVKVQSLKGGDSFAWARGKGEERGFGKFQKRYLKKKGTLVPYETGIDISIKTPAQSALQGQMFNPVGISRAMSGM